MILSLFHIPFVVKPSSSFEVALRYLKDNFITSLSITLHYIITLGATSMLRLTLFLRNTHAPAILNVFFS